MLSILLKLYDQAQGITWDGYVFPVRRRDGNYSWPALEVKRSILPERGLGLFAAQDLPRHSKIPWLGIRVRLTQTIRKFLDKKQVLQRNQTHMDLVSDLLAAQGDRRGSYLAAGTVANEIIDPTPDSILFLVGRANEPSPSETANCFYAKGYLMTKHPIPAGTELLWCYGKDHALYKTSCQDEKEETDIPRKVMSIKRYLERFSLQTDIINDLAGFQQWFQATPEGKKAWKDFLT